MLPFVPLPDPAAWKFIAVSAMIHFAYYVTLAQAYRTGDLSFAYPLMRGTAPLIVAVLGIVFLHELPTFPGAVGIVLICAGIWGPTVGAMAGVPIPLLAVQHQLVWTEPLPELTGETREIVHPILRHQDFAMYFRQREDHYGVGSYHHEPIASLQSELPAPGGELQPSLMPFTPRDFGDAEAEAARLLPALAGSTGGIVIRDWTTWRSAETIAMRLMPSQTMKDTSWIDERRSPLSRRAITIPL